MRFLQLLGVLCFSRTHKSLMRFLLLASDLEVVFYSKVAILQLLNGFHKYLYEVKKCYLLVMKK